jgi:3D-(3,5/4)-trihydroxycyclohexane-1,2-dione acylhydrolase (decyclizing)
VEKALEEIRAAPRTSVIVVETDKEARVPGYESWWDVPVAEVSEMETVQRARERYQEAAAKERIFVARPGR